MTHFTYTGIYAGKLLCGKQRQTAKDKGERLVHIPSTEAAHNMKDIVCKGCMAVYADSFKGDNGEWEDDTPQWVKDVK